VLVDRMADARHDGLARAKSSDDRARRFGWFGVRRRLLEKPCGAFDAAHERVAQAGDARRDRALERFRRAKVSKTRREHAWCQTMLDESDDQRFEHATFLRGR